MGKLNEDQVKFYEDHGYIVLDLLTEAEVNEVSVDYDEIFRRKAADNLEGTWKGNWNSSKESKVLQSIHGLQMHSAVFTRLLLNTALLDACECVMKTPNILLHHTKAHTKPPGKGSPFPMHQDYHYFPYKNDSMVAVFLNLDDSSPENGGLCVYPGSHKLGPQQDVSDTEGYHYLDTDKFPIEKATPISLKRGQILVFSYLLVHGSYPNTSERIRRMILIQLMAADDVPLKLVHRSTTMGMVLRGCNATREADITKRHDNEVS